MSSSTGVSAQSKWADRFLDEMRQAQDLLADTVVSELFASGQVQSVNQLMRSLVENDGVPAAGLPFVVKRYLERSGQLPDWMDAAKMKEAEQLFFRYGPAIVAVLLCYSLPFDYAARKGVQVLALTSRLFSNAERRVVETAQMIVDVMRPGGLGSLGTGIRSSQKVRLMHAAVRFLIGRHESWRAEWDKPINQEDMAGTLLSFSFITLDGLRKLGYPLTNDECEAYLHHWNVVGHILGIREDLMATNMADAAALAGRIGDRQFAPCDEGRMMAGALVRMMQHIIPGNLFDGVPVFLMRQLQGERVAEILGIGKAPAIETLLTPPLRAVLALQGAVTKQSPVLMRIHELFGRLLIEGLVLSWRGGTRVGFTIPEELLQVWGVNWR